MFSKIRVVIVALALICGVSSTSNGLSIPSIAKYLTIDAASRKAGCNQLIASCEVSTLQLNWRCERNFPNERTCSGTLNQSYFLNDVSSIVFKETLTPDQVTYNRLTHRVTVASSMLASAVVFARSASPENVRRIIPAEFVDTEPVGVCPGGCAWIPRIISSSRTYVLKATMGGFIHPIEGNQLEEKLIISHERVRLL